MTMKRRRLAEPCRLALKSEATDAKAFAAIARQWRVNLPLAVPPGLLVMAKLFSLGRAPV